MTSVNVTTTKNTVTVNGETRVVTVKTAGPQGPAFSDGDKGDVTVSNNGTAISINNDSITSAKIADGAIVNADINASAAIALSKLATGALPTAITVTSANISDLSIVDADISGSAAISLSKLATGALPTAITVTSANISDLSIVNADINASAAIAGTKISPDFGSQNIVTTGTGATGALGVTGNITVSGTVDGRDVATDGTKLDGIETGATADQTKADIDALGIAASTATTLATSRNIGGVSFNGSANIDLPGVNTAGNQNTSGNAATATTLQTARTIAGTSFDGSANIDISYTNLTNKLSVGDGGLTQNNFTDALKTKLDGIETAATADQTAAEIKTLLDSNGIVNSNVDASAAIAGTKISPDFGSQTIQTTGKLIISQASTSIPEIEFTGGGPNFIRFHDSVDSNVGLDFIYRDVANTLAIEKESDSTILFSVDHDDGQVIVTNNLDVGAGLDVTGNITVTGTVDGVDIATRDTLFGGLTSSSGVLTNGVTATTQSASDNSTKVATTAYTDTAIANLVDSAPGTLNTLNELAAALGDDANFSTTVTNSIATKLPLAGGTLTGNLILNSAFPKILLTDSDHNSDYSIQNANGDWRILDETNNVTRFTIAANGTGNFAGNLDIGAGVDVTGNITVTGTVDGRDVATDGTKLDGITANAIADLVEDTTPQLGGNLDTNSFEISLDDDHAVKFGNDNDLAIYYNTTSDRSIVASNGARLDLRSDSVHITSYDVGETMATFTDDGAVELYYDNSKKFETTSFGAEVTGTLNTGGLNASGNISNHNDTSKIRLGTSQDLEIYHDGTDSFIVNKTGDLFLRTTGSGDDIFIESADDATIKVAGSQTGIKATGGGAVELYHDNSKKLETTSSGATVTGNLFATNKFRGNDNVKLDLGTGNDFQIYHDGSNSIIRNYNTSTPIYIQPADSETGIKLTANGSTELYYDNSKKFETNANGVLLEDDARVTFGDSNDGDLRFRSATNALQLSVNNAQPFHLILGGEDALKAFANGAVELYYDNVKKAETYSNGLIAHHHLKVMGAQDQNAVIQMFADEGDNTDDQFLMASEHNPNRWVLLGQYVSGWHRYIQVLPQAGVQLYYDDLDSSSPSPKLETTSAGVTVTGTVTATSFSGDGSNLTGITASADLVNDTSPQLGGTLESNGQIIHFADSNNANNMLRFGADSDLQLYHNGTHSYIKDAGTGSLILTASQLAIQNAAATETLFVANQNGSVDLYYDDSKKFETTSSGVTVTGDIALGDNKTIRLGDGSNGDFRMLHGGTNTTLRNLTGQLQLRSDTIVFENNDGSDFATVTGIKFGDNNKARFGNGNDLQIYHDSSATANILLADSGSINIRMNSSENAIVARQNGAAELYYDNSKKLQTQADGVEINGSNGLQVYGGIGTNSNGNITVYPTGSGAYSNLLLYNAAGTVYSGLSAMYGGALYVLSGGNSNITYRAAGTGDHAFETNGVERFRIDGTDIKLPDSQKINFGAGNDLQIYHDGSHSVIDNLTGGLFIKGGDASNGITLQNRSGNESMAKFLPNGAVELYHDNTKTFETKYNGIIVLGGENNNAEIEFHADEGDDNADKWRLKADTNGQFEINNFASGSYERSIECNANGNVELYFDNTLRAATVSSGLRIHGVLSTNVTSGQAISLADNARADFGNGDDLQIYHDGSASYIDNTHSGGLYIRGGSSTGYVVALQAKNSENSVKCIGDGAVELYYDNSAKFETFSWGARIHGNLSLVDNNHAFFGAGNDLDIYHDGTNSFIDGGNTHALKILSLNFRVRSSADNENILNGVEGGAVELYYDGNKKLETKSNGAGVNGSQLTLEDSSGTVISFDESGTRKAFIGTRSFAAHDGDGIMLQTSEVAPIKFAINNVIKAVLDSNGDFVPGANNASDLGTSAKRWANVYTNDLNLSNEGGSNDVDGTWGSYTIQEGAEDLFLVNKRNGKKYKFNLTEVS